MTLCGCKEKMNYLHCFVCEVRIDTFHILLGQISFNSQNFINGKKKKTSSRTNLNLTTQGKLYYIFAFIEANCIMKHNQLELI